ncbi:AI-2E family transporter [Jannaschia sp. 2305UL9-9]|uniref:AI-2E family transporter n=1 Tax=Jannaschia sp. 2305UL9-9 TaxID=3121638 RepID=UPI0035289B89
MSLARATSAPLWILAVVALAFLLHSAASLFSPVVMALVLGVVLSPVTRRIDRLGAPRALSAFLTLALMLGLVVSLLVLVEPVLSSLIARAPIIWSEMSDMIAAVRSTAEGLDRVSDQVEDALREPGANAVSDDAALIVPKVSDALYLAPDLAAWIMIMVGTLYFFLLARRDVYKWMSISLSLTSERLLRAEQEVSRYLLTITLINAGFGALLGAILWLLGMPYPALWGFVAFLANYILYLGPAGFAVSLFIGGVVAFDGPISFVPAAIYVSLNLTEGQFVTPSLVGRQMAVNPLLVFLSLVFWLWLWGPVGGIVAIPLLVWSLALLDDKPTSDAAQSGRS